jgi:DNA-binding LacI/PurR family transcriptional regulator
MASSSTDRTARYLYEEIRDEILGRIESGAYHIGDRLPSTRTLVDEFSTTPVTINRALSDLVASGHIRRVAKSGSFVNARELWNGGKRERTGLVGIIAFDMQISVYWTQVVEAMQNALEARSLHAVIGYSEHSFEKAHNYVDDLVDKGIDGLIYVPIDAPDGETYERENCLVCEHIEQRGIPFVLFDRRLEQNRFPSVTADVYAAGADLMHHLADAGVKHPICLTVEHSQAIYERERAFLEIGPILGMGTAPGRVIRFPGPRVYESQTREFQKLIDAAPDFDGLFVANSNLYTNLLKIEEAGSRRFDVPIVTYRDLETESPDRPIARALQPVRDFGTVAGQLLGRLIESDCAGSELGAFQHVVLPVPVEYQK